MELIVTALLTLLGQAGRLVKLWSRIGSDNIKQEEVAAEIKSILKWNTDTNAEEWDALKEKLKDAPDT